MTSPVIAVGEDTEISDIAKLLTAYRIKRVPVVHDGRVVGRADLVRALAMEDGVKPGWFAGALSGIDDRFLHLHHRDERPKAASDRPEGDETQLTVADFRGLVLDHQHKKTEEWREQPRAMAEQRRRRIVELIDQHISDISWHALIHRARQAAEQGEKEFMLLRFPSQLCGDGGRAINSGRPGWAETLRGEAAELYLRWTHDLKPHGFVLTARVLDFPGGMPGDIGLFLG
jgi:hypothetical protein